MKISTSQANVLSKLASKFRKTLPEIIPDFEGADKKRENFHMTRLQIEDFAWRTFKESLRNL